MHKDADTLSRISLKIAIRDQYNFVWLNNNWEWWCRLHRLRMKVGQQKLWSLIFTSLTQERPRVELASQKLDTSISIEIEYKRDGGKPAIHKISRVSLTRENCCVNGQSRRVEVMDFQEKGVKRKLTVGSAVAIHYLANKELYTRRWSSQLGSERILQLAPERFTGPTCNVTSLCFYPRSAAA